MAPMRVNVKPSHNSRSSSKGGAARLSDVGPGATMHCTSVQSHTCQELWSCAHKCAMWCVNPHRDEKGELPRHSRLDEFCCAQTKTPLLQLTAVLPDSAFHSQMCWGAENYNHSINGCRVFGVVYEGTENVTFGVKTGGRNIQSLWIIKVPRENALAQSQEVKVK